MQLFVIIIPQLSIVLVIRLLFTTGDSFFWEKSSLSNVIFEGFLKDFSNQNPKELKNYDYR